MYSHHVLLTDMYITKYQSLNAMTQQAVHFRTVKILHLEWNIRHAVIGYVTSGTKEMQVTLNFAMWNALLLL